CRAGPVPREHRFQPGLSGRPEGLHGGRPGRDRKPDRCRLRRVLHRLRRGDVRQLRVLRVGPGRGLHDSDHHLGLPPGRPVRPAARRAGMSAQSAIPAASPTKGPGMRAQIAALSARHRSMSVLVGGCLVALLLAFVVLVPPFSGFSPQNVWVDGFTNAGVYVLLALGLNIVVGMSGLLDLGYAAFFAIGAYVYAFAASPFYGNDLPF